nr:unnamed protein product [uncultured bacterium]
MNRNAEAHYSQIPHANIQRAKFKRDFSYLTTINEGDLVPIYVDEVLPGDTIKIKQRSLVRMSTPLYPVMDNCYLDIWYFFVPCRLVWDHWQNLMGENTKSYWAPDVQYTTPLTSAPSGGWQVGTIADYMGIPTGVSGIKVNSMPMRAYARIWNEWFRDENLQQPVTQHSDDATTTGSNTGTELTDAESGGLPLKVAKFKDYFTSCLPAPQKGEAIGFDFNQTPKVKGIGLVFPLETNTGHTATDILWRQPDAQLVGENYNTSYNNFNSITTQTTVNGKKAFFFNNGKGPMLSARFEDDYNGGVEQVELTAVAENSTNFLSINDLRQAIALQHILEADARGGTRYVEILKNEFGVSSPDARLQRSEYIGGERIPINVSQVIQSSASDTTSPQGNAAAYSLTTSANTIRAYSAVEHGYILGLAAIRVDHSYQQGLSRMWTRSDRFSYYHPMLANLGEQAVLNQEIYAQGTTADTEVFGYQEAWADYRYRTNMITGEMRSTYAQSLDAWHYGDKYTDLPRLSNDWIKEGQENIDRTLAVQSENSHQFICNLYFDQTWVRPMPIYSVPGLSMI